METALRPHGIPRLRFCLMAQRPSHPTNKSHVGGDRFTYSPSVQGEPRCKRGGWAGVTPEAHPGVTGPPPHWSHQDRSRVEHLPCGHADVTVLRPCGWRFPTGGSLLRVRGGEGTVRTHPTRMKHPASGRLPAPLGSHSVEEPEFRSPQQSSQEEPDLMPEPLGAAGKPWSLWPPGPSGVHRSTPAALLSLREALSTFSWLRPVSSACSIVDEREEVSQEDVSLSK